MAYISTIKAHLDVLPHTDTEENSNEMWRKIRDVIQSAAKNTLAHAERMNRNEWFNYASQWQEKWNLPITY